jgi:hypothetical protein
MRDIAASLHHVEHAHLLIDHLAGTGGREQETRSAPTGARRRLSSASNAPTIGSMPRSRSGDATSMERTSARAGTPAVTNSRMRCLPTVSVAPVTRIVTGDLEASPAQSHSRSRKHDAIETHREQGSIAHASV